MRTARLTIVLQSARHSPCGSRIRGFRLSLATALRFFTNHETRITKHGFYAFHETRDTNHGFFPVGAPGWRHRKPPSGPLRPSASHCFQVHRCSPLFTVVHYCSPLFGKKYCWEPVSPRRPVAASLGAFARHGAASRGYRAACAGGVGGKPVSVPRPPFSVGLAASAAAGQLPLPRAQNEPMLRKGCVPDSVGAPRRHLRFGATRWALPIDRGSGVWL